MCVFVLLLHVCGTDTPTHLTQVWGECGMTVAWARQLTWAMRDFGRRAILRLKNSWGPDKNVFQAAKISQSQLDRDTLQLMKGNRVMRKHFSQWPFRCAPACLWSSVGECVCVGGGCCTAGLMKVDRAKLLEGRLTSYIMLASLCTGVKWGIFYLTPQVTQDSWTKIGGLLLTAALHPQSLT